MPRQSARRNKGRPPLHLSKDYELSQFRGARSVQLQLEMEDAARLRSLAVSEESYFPNEPYVQGSEDSIRRKSNPFPNANTNAHISNILGTKATQVLPDLSPVDVHDWNHPSWREDTIRRDREENHNPGMVGKDPCQDPPPKALMEDQSRERQVERVRESLAARARLRAEMLAILAEGVKDAEDSAKEIECILEGTTLPSSKARVLTERDTKAAPRLIDPPTASWRTGAIPKIAAPLKPEVMALSHEDIQLEDVRPFQPEQVALPYEPPQVFMQRLRDGDAVLPHFSGNAEDWLEFRAAVSDAQNYYTERSLKMSLKSHLKGEALATAKTSFILGESVEVIMSQLQEAFGRPDFILRAIREKLRRLSIPEIGSKNQNEQLSALVHYSNAVRGLIAAMSRCTGNSFNNLELITDLSCRLPISMRLAWGHLMNTKNEVSLKDFSDWIASYAAAARTVATEPLMTSQAHRARFYYHEEQQYDGEKSQKLEGLEPPECLYCEKGRHFLSRCQKFRDLTPSERRDVARLQRCCYGCLRGVHFITECTSKRSCTSEGCDQEHHGMLCLKFVPKAKVSKSGFRGRPNGRSGGRWKPRGNWSPRNQVTSAGTDHEEPKQVLTSRQPDSKVLFKILPVTLYGPNDLEITIFALFDEGSSISLLDQSVADCLQLQGTPQPLCLRWTGEVVKAEERSQIVTFDISGRGSTQKYRIHNVRTVERLALQPQSIDISKLKANFPYLSSAALCSVQEAYPQMIIGIDQHKLGVSLKQYERGWNEPIASKTRLGWVVYGPLGQGVSTAAASINYHQCECQHKERELNQSLKHFFSTEAFGVKHLCSPLEAQEIQEARDTFENTIKRIGDRWETGLLWKKGLPPFKNTRPMAMKRWKCLQQKMSRDPKLCESMTATIEGYLAKGYARKLTSSEARALTPRTNYLPMFGVWNASKMKFRAVSDAAAKVDGLCLNDYLSKGPKLYTNIFSMLFNFRLGKYGLIGDIAEMFHQVVVRKEDQDAQRFFWTSSLDPNTPPEEYIMMVMTFGATCSPSLAQMVKNRNAEEFRGECPMAVDAIIKKHYVDDLLYSCDSIDEMVQVAKDIVLIHKRGGFEMRGFVSNSRDVMLALGQDPNSTGAIKPLKSDPDGLDASEMVLGLVWDIVVDAFKFRLNFHRVSPDVMSASRAPTRREVASAMGSLFDPLGLVAHFKITLALLSQELTKSGLNWDDTIKGDFLLRWQLWLKELPLVGTVCVPRPLSILSLKDSKIELHVFVDASDRAFAAVAYARIEHSPNNIIVSFLAARAKVGPIKQISVNRMELQAAILGCRLANQIATETELKFTRRWFWYDSQTVGAWINSKHRTYKTFVALRVSELLEDSQASEWRYIRSHLNPADLATKRVGETQFELESFWYSGPSFLKNEPAEWPNEKPPHLRDEKVLEQKATEVSLLVHTVAKGHVINVEKFSSWWVLARTMATVFRAVDTFKRKSKRDCTPQLTTRDQLDSAERFLYRLAQGDGFSNEITLLTRERPLPSNSTLLTLSPCLDDLGVLRMNSRLKAASKIPTEARCPIILPRNHWLTGLKIMQFHRKFAHQNVETVVNELHQQFWIPQIRVETKKIISRCQFCRNSKAKPTTPQMSALPAARVSPYTSPFASTGVDLAGPYDIKINRSLVKRWIVVFTCLTMRAVHIEVAHSLSSDSFILCLRNFVNRRGECRDMYSDCGTNFKGADKELKRAIEELNLAKVAETATIRGIKWHWNPPASPHMGGAWERMVRSIKTVLKVLLQGHPLKEDTFQSFLIEAEFIINSRPLTFVALEAPNEEALTPNHFLLGSSSGLKSQEPVCLFEHNARKQWKHAQELADHFWRRWVREYAPIIARRSKWFAPTKPTQIGDCVLIVNENAPRNSWEKGVVVELHQSPNDGVVRSATVKTSRTLRRRPIVKLAILDVTPDEATPTKKN